MITVLLLPSGELCLHSKEIRLKKENVKKRKNNAEKNEEKDRFRKVREEGSEVMNKRGYRQFF